MTSCIFISSCLFQVDAVFLDADHSFEGVQRDLAAFQAAKLVVGHDFSWERLQIDQVQYKYWHMNTFYMHTYIYDI